MCMYYIVVSVAICVLSLCGTEAQEGDIDLDVLKKKIEKSRKFQKKVRTTSSKH